MKEVKFQEYQYDSYLAGRKRPDIGLAVRDHYGDRSKYGVLRRIFEKHLKRLKFPS